LPTREQVRELLDQGLDYRAAGSRLGIPAGQAYLIATGRPADGSDTPSAQEQEGSGGRLLAASQQLANPPHDNPTGSKTVRDWIAARVAADGQLREAAAQRTAEPGEPEAPDVSQDITDVLTRQHNQVEALQKQLAALPGHRKGGTPADLAKRKSIVDLMTARLAAHETAEEAHLWPAVRAALPEGDRWADGALQQEQESNETLAALGPLGPDTDEFDDLVEQLISQLRKHVAYEARVFLLLRDTMPEDEREKLGKKVASAARQGPTRPHSAPRKPGAAVKAAAAGAAPVDKMRDAAGDRPAKRKGKAE
jgi:hemerythrin superfamily protein